MERISCAISSHCTCVYDIGTLTIRKENVNHMQHQVNVPVLVKTGFINKILADASK